MRELKRIVAGQNKTKRNEGDSNKYSLTCKLVFCYHIREAAVQPVLGLSSHVGGQ